MRRFYRRILFSLRIAKTLFGKKRIYESVTIRGNEEFIAATIEALDLLKERTPDVYQLVFEVIGDIVAGKPSGVFPDMLWLGPTFIIIGPSYSERSPVEYAGALAHEAYHCKLYKDAKMKNPKIAVQQVVYSGEHAEKMCLQYQCNVLRRIGLDEDTIKNYENGLHTRWWEIPYERRDW